MSLRPLVLVCGAVLLVAACNKAPPDTPIAHMDTTTTGDKSYQQYFDQAQVVCRDGWAYLAGWVGDTHGGPFVVPYLHDGKQGRCVGQKVEYPKGANH